MNRMVRLSILRRRLGPWFCLVLLCLSGCTKFDALDATIPACGYRRVVDLAYGSGPRQKLDVYEPTHPDAAHRVIVFFYGGSWQAGNKGDYRFVAQALASRGFVAVLPDYRLYPGVTFPAFVQDGALAVRWAHANISRFGGDPKHLYLMGHSAGAHIAALLTLDGSYLRGVGLDRSAIRATAGLAGPYDFVPDTGTRAVFSMSAHDPSPNPDIEPIHFVDGREPPMLLLHGLEDTTVGPDNTIHLANRIRQAHGDVQTIYYPGLGHVGLVLSLAFPFRWLAPVLDDTVSYFRRH